MMFVCYSLTLGIMGAAYQYPDEVLFVLLLAALWRTLMAR